MKAIPSIDARHGLGHGAFVKALESGFPSIRTELDRLDFEMDFIDWPLFDAYSGTWRVFPLFFPGEPYLPVDLARNQALCPETTRLLRGLSGLQGAGFSLLGPGTRVHIHTDHYAPGAVRCHLGLRVPEGVKMNIADREIHWEEGRCLLFDGQVPHEAVNSSDQVRIVLLADFMADSPGSGPR